MITATIVTLNEEHNIKDCINSVKKVCDEVIVVDSLSEDKTKELARKLGAVVIEQKYLGGGPQRNLAAKYATNEWILNIDADERLDQDMIEDIKRLKINENTYDSYSFKRKNYIGDRLQKVWYPDRLVRLYNKNTARFEDSLGHAKVIAANPLELDSHIIHYTYKDIFHMLQKLDGFVYRGAHMLYKKNKKVSPLSPLVHSVFAFVRKYFFKKGFLYGRDGLTISVFSAFNTYVKYAMLIEMYENDKKSK